jgi:hypothetical protein
MFQLKVRASLKSFAGGGIGVLNQLLSALPSDINLIRLSHYIAEREGTLESNHIELIGHWDLSRMRPDPQAKRDHMEKELSRVVETLDLHDADGVRHTGTLSVVDFSNPRTLYPRVFISYSTGWEQNKLDRLWNALWENHFEPMLGTDYNEHSRETSVAGRSVSPDIVNSSFGVIPGCVAFISLQVKRDDFKVT